MQLYFYFYFSRNRVSVCSSDCHRAYHVDQAGLEVTEIPMQVSLSTVPLHSLLTHAGQKLTRRS